VCPTVAEIGEMTYKRKIKRAREKMDWEIHGDRGVRMAEIVALLRGVGWICFVLLAWGGVCSVVWGEGDLLCTCVILSFITCVCGGNTSQLTFSSVFKFFRFRF
jgi:uncharacterized membrane protein